MTVFVTYDTATNRLLQVSVVPDSFYDQMPDITGLGRVVIEGGIGSVDPEGFMNTHFVSAGTLAAKAAITPTVSATSFAADGTTTVTIAGLPDPCRVTISGVLWAGPTDVTGGSIDISSDVAGDLTVSVSAEPAWLSWSTILHAV